MLFTLILNISYSFSWLLRYLLKLNLFFSSLIILGQEQTILNSLYSDYSTNVLEVANQFSEGGYQWGGISGVCIPLVHNREVIRNYSQGDKTHCSGFTLSIAFIVATNRGLLKDKDQISVARFSSQWYSEGGIQGKLCVDALINLGIGEEISFDDVRPGDFCQIWRTNGSGHTVIFINYLFEEGEIIGMRYRSSQNSTNGIGTRIEYFSDSGKGEIDKKYTFFGRLNSN